MQTSPCAVHSLPPPSSGVAASSAGNALSTGCLAPSAGAASDGTWASGAMASSAPPSALGEDDVTPPQDASTNAAIRWNVRVRQRLDALIRNCIARRCASKRPAVNARPSHVRMGSWKRRLAPDHATARRCCHGSGSLMPRTASRLAERPHGAVTSTAPASPLRLNDVARQLSTDYPKALVNDTERSSNEPVHGEGSFEPLSAHRVCRARVTVRDERLKIALDPMPIG